MRIGEMKESKYIKKEDVGEAGKNLTISRVDHQNIAKEGMPEEMRYVIFFKEAQKGMVLNWTNIQLIAKITGSEDTDDWSGKVVQLYEDPSISFGGEIKGGIRVRKAHNVTSDTTPNTEAGDPGVQSEDDFGDSIPF